MQLVSSPLFIEDRSGSNSEGKRGSTLKRRIVVKNLGDRSAEIDIWIVATDPTSEPLLRWCTFSERNPFRLDAKASREVVLTFDLPQQAVAAVYNYEVLVDAQAQYPDKPPVRRPQQIKVLPSEDAEWGTDPIFTVHPITQAAQPHCLQAGQSLDVVVRVKNCSKRVDRLYLTCPELTQNWFTVHYPESSLETPGLVNETDGLELNPGSGGEIILTFHPPQHLPAGNYFPTLRLTSSNDDQLVLLDVVYLQILVSDRLDLQLHPTLQRLPSEPGEFDLSLTNQGNVSRKLMVRATDPDQLFNYTIDPGVVSLEPGQVEPLYLKVTPKQWWGRPWWGNGRELQFDIALEDFYSWQSDSSIAPPVLTSGTILWQARPWWLPVLLMLAGVGTIGAIALLIWLKFFNPPAPAPQPQIAALENTLNSTVYRADSGEAMRLDWQISRLSDIDRIVVVHLERGVEIDRKNYLFAGKIPAELQRRPEQTEFCETMTVDKTDGLSCQGMPIATAQAGTHTFQLQVFSTRDRRTPADVRTTDSVAIASIAQPTIVQFSPAAAVYQVPSQGQVGAIAPPIRLNWDVSAPTQIQELQIVGIAADGSITSPLQRFIFEGRLPTDLQGFCTFESQLVCRNVPTTATQAGAYAFQLTLISRQTGQETMKRTPLIQIQPPPLQIQSFQLNGEDVGQTPSFRFELSPNQPTIVTLSWQVEASQGMQVELLPVPGSVPAQGSIDYPLSAPGQQTLTLRVTNQAGEQITRSIVLEAFVPAIEPAPSPPTTMPKPPTSSPTPKPSPPALPIEPNPKPPEIPDTKSN